MPRYSPMEAQDSCNAPECAQAGVVEAVIARDGAEAGVFDDPGTESALGGHRSFGPGVGQDGIEFHGAIGAYVGQLDGLDGEFEGKPPGLGGFEEETGIRTVDAVNFEFRQYSGCGRGRLLDRFGRGFGGVGEMRAGRDIDMKAGNAHHGNADRLTGFVMERGVETEAVDLDKRRRWRRGWIRGRSAAQCLCGRSRRPNTQSFALGGEAVKK